jgi:hypothetical protein
MEQEAWEQVLDCIEKKKYEPKKCKANINELDDDLHETLVKRSKILGKDHLNKYYWFGHSGMPFGGVPNSATAEYGYANSRIWVQGPDTHKLQLSLEEPALSEDRKRIGFDIPQRKQKERATLILPTPHSGHNSNPEDVDKLLAWLGDRGVRERALRKDFAGEYEADDTTSSIYTRSQTYGEKEAIKDRCMHWTNSIMWNEYGHNHS